MGNTNREYDDVTILQHLTRLYGFEEGGGAEATPLRVTVDPIDLNYLRAAVDGERAVEIIVTTRIVVRAAEADAILSDAEA